MRTVHFEKLRPDEIIAERERCSIVYLPIGPLEWHGPAMPLGTDPLAAAYTAEKTAEQVGGVVMPTLFMGTERERPSDALEYVGLDRDDYIVGMDYPKNSMKSLYAREDVFSLAVREHLRWLTEQKYKLIIIVNGHGAANQTETLRRLSIEFTGETDSTVVSVLGVCTLNEDDMDFGHATRLETSIQMYLNPDSVDLSKLPPKGEKLKSADWGIVDGATFAGHPNADKTVMFDPRESTAGLGGQYMEAAVAMLTKFVREAYDRLQ